MISTAIAQEVMILARRHWTHRAAGLDAQADVYAAELYTLLLRASGFERDDETQTDIGQHTLAGFGLASAA